MTHSKVTKDKKEISGNAKASLILGILSIVLFWVPGLHFILAVLGIVFGAIATANKERLGLVGLLLSVGSWIPVLISWAVAMNQVSDAMSDVYKLNSDLSDLLN